MTDPIWLEGYDEGVPATLEPYPERTLLDYLSESARNWPDRPALLFKGADISYRQLSRTATLSRPRSCNWRQARCRSRCVCPTVRSSSSRNSPPGRLARSCARSIRPTPIVRWSKRFAPPALKHSSAESLLLQGKALSGDDVAETNRPPRTSRYLPFFLRIAYTLLKEKKEGDRISVRNGDYRLTHLKRAFRGVLRPAGVVAPSDPSVILLSGGTTGTPKGVVGLHGGMVVAGLQLQAWLRPASGSGPTRSCCHCHSFTRMPIPASEPGAHQPQPIALDSKPSRHIRDLLPESST